MLEFFRKLFDTSDFTPRWDCGQWSAGHGWLHILSDLAITGAYFAIPLALSIYYFRKRSDLPFPGLIWLFGAFIFSCGTTHLIEALIFYQPIYRFSGLLKATTAAVSWATVVAIIGIAPRAFKLPGIVSMNQMLNKQVALQQKTAQELERSNRDLQEFTLVVSHDLRSPISSALFMAELAKESEARKDGASLSNQLDLLLANLRQMETFVADLHERALVRSNTESMETVDLTRIAEAAQVTLTKQISESGATISIGRLPEITAVKSLLIQLFTNLLSNAIKYSPGRVPLIRIEATEDADEIMVSFSDNGRGIPVDQIGKIFEPMVRVDHDPNITGSGVGLAVCRTIMEAHGGSIGAVTNPAGGMTFNLRFPKNVTFSLDPSA